MGQAGGGLVPLPDKAGPAVEGGGFTLVQQVQPMIKAGPGSGLWPFRVPEVLRAMSGVTRGKGGCRSLSSEGMRTLTAQSEGGRREKWGTPQDPAGLSWSHSRKWASCGRRRGSGALLVDLSLPGPGPILHTQGAGLLSLPSAVDS